MVGAVNFGQLVGLMVWGTGEPDAFRGIVRHVEDGQEHRYRLARHEDLSRLEELDGTVRKIVGASATWFRDADTGLIRVRVHDERPGIAYARAPIGGLDVGGPRPSWERWMGTDFTHPTGPVAETEFLGRPALAVELAPPSHKPYPLQLVVDAATGLLLRRTNEGFGLVEEWVEFEQVPDLPDELFVWAGPADPVQTRAERNAAWEAEEAERAAWLAHRGIETLPLSTDCAVMLHHWDDDTGSFYASLDARMSGALIRRPHSEGAWSEADSTDYAYSWRWSDTRWDWFLATETPLSESAIADVRTRLSSST